MNQSFDVIVIGGGPAGYAAAIRLAQADLRVACIEREAVGGICLNWGCIPSKALISTAQTFEALQRGAELGVMSEGVWLDLPRAQARSRGIVKHHTDGIANLLRSNGARLIQGRAELASARQVRVFTEAGGELVLEARRAVVVATGSTPRRLAGFDPDGERVVTAREAVFFERLPEHLIVLGGGVIGLELAGAYQRLGSKVTIVELTDSLLPGVDADLVAVVQKRLERHGAQVLTRTRALGWEPSAPGARVEVETGGQRQFLEGSRVLVAAGFVPNSRGFGLSEVGVALDERGHVVTDAKRETNVPGVFAIGDVAGPPYLAHKAYKEAEVLAEVLRGRRVTVDYRAMPNVIFTAPEIASVGLTEAQARADGAEVTIGKFPFAALGRAQARGETEGFVKLIAIGERLVGAGIVGSEASELIAELTLALEVGTSLEDLALTVHAHPTLAEAVHEAAEQGLGQAVHVLNRKPRSPRAAAAE